MINLIGTYECKADAKGRVMFPSALKRQLQDVMLEGFVIKRSVFNNCLTELVFLYNKEFPKYQKTDFDIVVFEDRISRFGGGGRADIPTVFFNFRVFEYL